MSAEKLQALAETKFDLKVAKLNLLERIDSQLTFTHNGGLFKATPELMAIVNFYSNADDNNIILLDEYKNPIMVEITELTKLVLRQHQFALNAYSNEYNDLKAVRKGDKL